MCAKFFELKITFKHYAFKHLNALKRELNCLQLRILGNERYKLYKEIVDIKHNIQNGMIYLSSLHLTRL